MGNCVGAKAAYRVLTCRLKMLHPVLLSMFIVLVPSRCSAQPGGSQALQQLTAFRKNHRRTVDGRLCAAAFVQDDQTYTDCTTARAPNGTAGHYGSDITLWPRSLCELNGSGGEWCYVEVQLLGKGTSDWNYCVPPINYGNLRSSSPLAAHHKLLLLVIRQNPLKSSPSFRDESCRRGEHGRLRLFADWFPLKRLRPFR